MNLPAKEYNPRPQNPYLMYFLGLIVLVLNKIRRSFKRYSSPRRFNSVDLNRNADYVLNVVKQWDEVAKLYTECKSPFLGKSILEIGPGPDLGTGIVLLASGAKNYHAIDMFPLAQNTSENYYEILFNKISNYPYVSNAKQVYGDFLINGNNESFAYTLVQYPLLHNLSGKNFDVVISQAVWEHISDPETTLINIMRFAKEFALFLNEVDLATHTRGIREIDPLNILRYGESIYSKLSFLGTPNRWRCSDYLALSEKLGFKNVKVIPIRRLSMGHVKEAQPFLAGEFRQKQENDLAVLSCWWLARFPGKNAAK